MKVIDAEMFIRVTNEQIKVMEKMQNETSSLVDKQLYATVISVLRFTLQAAELSVVNKD